MIKYNRRLSKIVWANAFLYFLLSISHITTATTVYLVRANLTLTGDVYEHAGIRFKDNKQDIECHFHPNGMLSSHTGNTPISDLNCINRDQYLGHVTLSVNNCYDWCKDWSSSHHYDLVNTNCWSMVHAFCQAHHIEVPNPPTHQVVTQAIADILGVKEFVKVARHVEEGHQDKAVEALVQAPLKAGSEGLTNAAKRLSKIKIKKPKW